MSGVVPEQAGPCRCSCRPFAAGGGAGQPPGPATRGRGTIPVDRFPGVVPPRSHAMRLDLHNGFGRLFRERSKPDKSRIVIGPTARGSPDNSRPGHTSSRVVLATRWGLRAHAGSPHDGDQASQYTCFAVRQLSQSASFLEAGWQSPTTAQVTAPSYHAAATPGEPNIVADDVDR